MLRSTTGRAGGYVKFPCTAVWPGNIATPNPTDPLLWLAYNPGDCYNSGLFWFALTQPKRWCASHRYDVKKRGVMVRMVR